MLDVSTWPIVRLTYPETVTDESLSEITKALIGVLQREQRFAMVIDGSRTLALSPKHRKMIVDVVDMHKQALSKYCIGQALVVKSAVSRGVVTAMMWLKAPPVPLKMFADMDSADAWVRGLLG